MISRRYSIWYDAVMLFLDSHVLSRQRNAERFQYIYRARTPVTLVDVVNHDLAIKGILRLWLATI